MNLTINLSEQSRFEDYYYLETIGYRGRVCEKCLIINIDLYFALTIEKMDKLKQNIGVIPNY